MASKLSVINRALGFLGERPIIDPDNPDTSPGRTIAEAFEDSRREVLRRYPWNFAEAWVEVNITTAPPFGYDDAYTLPDDFLRLIWVGEINQINRRYRLLYQGNPNFRRVIALNNSGANTLKIAYTADVTLLNLWDPLALKVLAIWLAMDASKFVTGQDTLLSTLNQMLTEELKDAVGVDGQEQPLLSETISPVQSARQFAQYPESFFTNVQFPT